MRTFKTWCEDNKIQYPKTNTINGSWFSENHLPMVVKCSCCEMTMCITSALIDDDDCIYCSSCAE